MRRIRQAFFYGLFGSVFVPLISVVLLFPPIILGGLIEFFFWDSPSATMTTESAGDGGVGLWILPALGFVAFALGGGLMRGRDGQNFDDGRLFNRFYSTVFNWMLFGVVFCTIWGAILGVLLSRKAEGWFDGYMMGIAIGEFAGLFIGAILSSLGLTSMKRR